MKLKSMNVPIFRLLIEAILACFLLYMDLKFLGMLLIVALISDVILIIAKKSDSYDEKIPYIGHYSYLSSLAYILFILLLNQSNILDLQTSFNLVFFGTILLFPIVSLFHVVKNKKKSTSY